MPMSFPTMQSLKDRATQRGFRQPEPEETEEQFRLAFGEFMKTMDFVEAHEILTSRGWDDWTSQDQMSLVSDVMIQSSGFWPEAK